jgi:2-keto-4-pentenoate hydratase
MDGVAVSTAIEGKVVGTGGAQSLPGGPLAGLRFLLAHLAERGRPLRKGQLVSSGAITGVHDIVAGQSSVITFEGCGAIECRAIPA